VRQVVFAFFFELATLEISQYRNAVLLLDGKYACFQQFLRAPDRFAQVVSGLASHSPPWFAESFAA
jgi:hypothetical protein